jgi:hypothetical protein
MAFQTGSQVNAALGRTDYTPFLQGAMQGAQAQARGAENIAAGLAGLGQQVATGIEKYYKKQEEKKVKQQGIDFIVKHFGVDEKAAAAGLSTLPPQAYIGLLQGEREKQINEQAAQYANVLDQSGGAPVSLESGPMSPVAEMRGREAFAKFQNLQSETAKNFAASNKQPVGQIMSLDEVENYKRAGFDVKSVPVGNGMLRVESVSPFGPAPVTNIKTGDDVVARETFGALKAQRDVALAATNAISAYEDANKLLKGKVITGAGAEATLALNKALGFFGIQSQQVADTEVLKARLAVPVFSLVKQLGAGTGISNADREYAEMAAGGKITLDKNAIIRLVEIGRKASQNTVDSYNQALDEAYPSDNKDYTSARAVLKLRKPRTAAEIVGLPQ